MAMRKPSLMAMLILVSILVTAGAFCLDYFVLSAPAQNNASPPPTSIATSNQTGLVFDDDEFDLGIAKKTVSHRFTYRNASTMPLKITNVRPSCSCVVSEPDCTTLQPGESGSITFEVDVSRKEPGAHRFLLFIDYEREDRKATATAALRVAHQPDLYITPRYVDITVTEGTRSSANITIIDYRKEPLKILKIRPTYAAIEAKINESPSEYLPGWRYVIGAAYMDSRKETRRREARIVRQHDRLVRLFAGLVPRTLPVAWDRSGSWRANIFSVVLLSVPLGLIVFGGYFCYDAWASLAVRANCEAGSRRTAFCSMNLLFWRRP
jgi:hypothetical protein